MGVSYSIKCKNCNKNDAQFRIIKKRSILPCYCDLRACQCNPRSNKINLFGEQETSYYCNICNNHKHISNPEKCFCGYHDEYNKVVKSIHKKYKKLIPFLNHPHHVRTEGIFSFYFYACNECITKTKTNKYFTEYKVAGYKGYHK